MPTFHVFLSELSLTFASHVHMSVSLYELHISFVLEQQDWNMQLSCKKHFCEMRSTFSICLSSLLVFPSDFLMSD